MKRVFSIRLSRGGKVGYLYGWDLTAVERAVMAQGLYS